MDAVFDKLNFSDSSRTTDLINKLNRLCTPDNIKDERIVNTLKFYLDGYFKHDIIDINFIRVIDALVYCMQLKYFFNIDLHELLEYPVETLSKLQKKF